LALTFRFFRPRALFNMQTAWDVESDWKQISGSSSDSQSETWQMMEECVIKTPEPWDVHAETVKSVPDQQSATLASIAMLQQQLQQVCNQVAEVNSHVAHLQLQLVAQGAAQQQCQEALARLLAAGPQYTHAASSADCCTWGGTQVICSPAYVHDVTPREWQTSPPASDAGAGLPVAHKPRARPGPRERLRQRQLELERKQRDAEANQLIEDHYMVGQHSDAEAPLKKRKLGLSTWHVVVATLVLAAAQSFAVQLSSLLLPYQETFPGLLESVLPLAANTTASHKEITGQIGPDGMSAEEYIEKMRHFGHLRLAVSQCGAAAEWFGTAVNASERLMAESSTAGVGLKVLQPKLRGDLGLALTCARRYEDAIENLRLAMNSYEAPPHWQNALGFAYFHSGMFPEAIAVFQAALMKHGDNPILWNNLAAAAMSLHSMDIRTADEALYNALLKVELLKHANSFHYFRQVIANNVHIFRARAKVPGGSPVLPAAPHVETYNCLVREVENLAWEGEKRFVQSLGHRDGATDITSQPDNQDLVDLRHAVLASAVELVLCPSEFS